VSHDDLQTAVDEAMQRQRYDNAQNFIFDLEGVEFLASVCIGVLVSFLQDVEHCRGRIALVHCTDDVAFLFKATRLDDVFGLYDEIEDAVAAL